MDEFIAQGEELFGKNKKDWKWRCVSCGEVQSYHDFEKIGVKEIEGVVHFSCIGRYSEARGCNWTLGGLFTIHEKEITGPNGDTHAVFNFEGEPYSNEREEAFKKKKTMAFEKV